MGAFQRRTYPILLAWPRPFARRLVGGAKGEGGSGSSEEDVVGSAGMLAEQMRLQSDYGM